MASPGAPVAGVDSAETMTSAPTAIRRAMVLLSSFPSTTASSASALATR
jgi:hypothetical protein